MNPYESPANIPSRDKALVKDLLWCYRWVKRLLITSFVPFLVPMCVLLAPLGFGKMAFILLSVLSMVSIMFQLVMIFQVMMELDGSPSLALNFNLVLLFFCLVKDFLVLYFVLTFEFPGPG